MRGAAPHKTAAASEAITAKSGSRTRMHGDYPASTGNPRHLENQRAMRVVQIWRYPVKSMGGEPLRSVELADGGMPFDRRYAVMDSDPNRAGKPLTARIERKLLGYGATVRDGEAYVRTSSGEEHRVHDPGWLEALGAEIERPVSLQSFDGAMHDDADILVINAASLRVLAEEYGAFVNPLRFRPNFVVDSAELHPFLEDAWAGHEIAVGGAVLRGQYPCDRCVLTTIDPETLATDPSFLRLVVEKHGGRFGIYCSVVRSGTVALGDEWRPQRKSEVVV